MKFGEIVMTLREVLDRRQDAQGSKTALLESNDCESAERFVFVR
jgi:hypothetical protein